MSKKAVRVNFVQYQEYEPHPYIVAELGTVSPETAQKIIDAFIANKNRIGLCLKPLHIDYTQHISMGNQLSSVLPYIDSARLDMDGMFYYNNYPLCSGTRRKTNDEQKIKQCARNLRAGKCCDEFIKNTLGVILFPQHYGKQK